MRLSSCVALVILLASGLTPAASAQGGEGDHELGFSAAFFHFTDDDSTDGTLIANLRYGHFLTESVQIGGGIFLGGPVDDIDASASFDLFAAYLFSPESTSTWYVKGGYFAPFDEPGDGAVDLAGGFKSYFTENVAFFWEAGYGFGISNANDGGLLRSTAGIVYTF